MYLYPPKNTTTYAAMFYHFLFFAMVALLLLGALCRRAALNALESVKTREHDTLQNTRLAIRVLFGDGEKVQFISTKDRSSSLLQGTSRRKGKRVVAQMLMERKKREDKISRVRSQLASKLKFQKKDT